MRIIVTSRHVEATPTVVAYAHEKASKAEHLFEGLLSVTVTLDVGRRGHAGQTAEFIVRIPRRGTCVALGRGKTLYEAIDIAENKLHVQLRRAKASLRRR